MFELDGTHFEKGVFELRLKKKLPAFIGRFIALGPIRGRLIALVFLLGASLLTFNLQPERFLLQRGWVSDPVWVRKLQLFVTYALAGIGGLGYAAIFLLREERLYLVFDRHEKALRFRHLPRFVKGTVREGLVEFAGIAAMEVYGPTREPKTSNGFMEIRVKTQPEPYDRFRFRFLSDEQFKIYPLNLMKLTGKAPSGDWTDPDDELLKS